VGSALKVIIIIITVLRTLGPLTQPLDQASLGAHWKLASKWSEAGSEDGKTVPLEPASRTGLESSARPGGSCRPLREHPYHPWRSLQLGMRKHREPWAPNCRRRQLQRLALKTSFLSQSDAGLLRPMNKAFDWRMHSPIIKACVHGHTNHARQRERKQSRAQDDSQKDGNKLSS